MSISSVSLVDRVRDLKPAGGKAWAIDDRGKQAEKVAGDCGSHKRQTRVKNSYGTYKFKSETDCLRRCKTVSQTGGAPEDDTQTVCDAAKTVCVPALDFHTVCDGDRKSLKQSVTTGKAPARDFSTVCGCILAPADPETVCDTARKSTRPAMNLQETPRNSKTVCDCARQSFKLAGHLHETPRQCATTPRQSVMVPMPSGHMQEILRQSATLPENLPDWQATRRRLLDSLRLYQDRLSRSRRLPDGARSLLDRQGTFRRIPDSLLRCKDRLVTSRILKDGDFQKSLTVPDSLSDQRGTCRRLSDNLRRCQDDVRTHTGDSQTVCDGARQSCTPVGHTQETPIHSATC
ncbi:hypothetical protein DPMN_010088 [Dreissena polymorpha]|uniref:Uncharacterized protein n=1 Tax=Dreissena polymorpha TaxID=45954 RepID=A0A9D4MY57_DREPO|nr:hypothetical protein DPMN_010088 [Dreissena polymorpha]